MIVLAAHFNELTLQEPEPDPLNPPPVPAPVLGSAQEPIVESVLLATQPQSPQRVVPARRSARQRAQSEGVAIAAQDLEDERPLARRRVVRGTGEAAAMPKSSRLPGGKRTSKTSAGMRGLPVDVSPIGEPSAGNGSGPAEEVVAATPGEDGGVVSDSSDGLSD